MSSPRNRSNGTLEIREGTRVVLKEITASLHNSPVKQTSPLKSGNDTVLQKSPEHAVKVQFAREFADIKTTTPSVKESLSSASSFQSLSSALSVDSPARSANTSYVNSDIDGLDDLIAACAGIKLSDQGELLDLAAGVGDLSQDQTFTSAVTDLSIVGENSEEESPKNECELNGTFDLALASDLSENHPESVSENPSVSVENSILKTHALDSVNKDSTVFSTAVEFQNFEKFAPKSVNEDKPNNSQNESILQSDSSNLESHFDASIESVKNVSNDFISVSGNSHTTLERTQTPSILLPPSISNVSTILEKDEPAENAIAASPNPESTQPEQISQSFNLNSTTLIDSGRSLTEDNLDSSNQEANIESGIIPPVSPQTPKEDTNVSQKEALNSTFSFSPDKVNSIPSDSNQCSEPEKSGSLLKSPIPQSILEKVAAQQKSLDAISTTDEEESHVEIEKPGSYNLLDQGDLEKNSQLSPVVETLSESQSSQPSPLAYIISPKQEILNCTVTLTPEKRPEAQEILSKTGENFNTPEQLSENEGIGITPSPVTKTEENFNAPEQSSGNKGIEITPSPVTKTGENFNTPEHLSGNKEIEITPSPEIAFLQQRSLNSTVIRSNENCIPVIPEIKVSSPGKSFDDTLRNKSSQSDSSNLTVKSVVEETTIVEVLGNDPQSEIPQTETPKRPTGKDKINGLVKEIKEDIKNNEKLGLETTIEATAPKELDSTVILEDSEIDLEAPDIPVLVADSIPEESYETFKPQNQSTDLNFGDPSLFDKLEFEAQAIAKEIYNKSLELGDDNEQFISATSELFQDPTSFDFLLSQESSNSRAQDLRFQSLYAKFDPLVNESMLPQGNSQPEVKEQNGKNELPSVPSVDTPKRNPAIAAIDRLLFYSPITTGNKTEQTKEMKQEASENSPQESVPVVDETMAKELALVRSVVMQLEEKLEKLEKDREEDNKKHEEQVKKLEEKNSRLESQLAQEIESKKQVTVVLDEYERSISRLVAERERDRADLDEKTRMKEELQAASQHLSNTEAAFNDVHQKYERLKGVVAAYKSNETVLKESVQENVETIKALENRYEQLKSHAMAQLEKANQELETIRKQNESESVKFQAMLRKAELKIKSLTDLVEQKTKENKELTQILDEVIARVGQNPE